MTVSSSKPGCFAALARLFGGGKPEPTAADADSFPYRTRDDFLSPAERSFYLVLKNMLGEHFTICPKVSLADVFFVTRPNENRSAFNRINRKHVDFLICKPQTMQPHFAIELDDRSHQNPDREERDEFVDAVFEAASLPLIHVPARNAYNPAELGLLFKPALHPEIALLNDLKISSDVQAPPTLIQTPPSSQPPLCPKCGVPMLLRIASKGAQAGKQFYGCPNFPKCREILPYQA